MCNLCDLECVNCGEQFPYGYEECDLCKNKLKRKGLKE
jgi:hypothetical protein